MTSPSADPAPDSQPVRIWSAPVRLFHWTLVACFITAWLTEEDRYLDIHIFAGYLMGGMILFRLLWGIVGGPYARFRDFSYGWRELLAFSRTLLQRQPRRYLGHNPAGSWAIYALLLLGLLQVITGLLGLGGEEQQGPLAGWLNYPQGHLILELHELLAWAMLAVVMLHLLGVALESLLHRENLPRSMVTGYKSAPAGSPAAPLQWKSATLLVLLILAAFATSFQGYLTATPDQPYRPFTGPKLPDNPLWREECEACHLAFHPSLLPERSWRAMMAEQGEHFGEDLMLEGETLTEIEAFLTANAAEQFQTEAAWKINRSIPPNETPLRITRTGYWIKKHREIDRAVWDDTRVSGKAHCAACHLDAAEGTFEDAAMRLPSGHGFTD